MAHAPENRVLLDNDASYYTAPQTRASRSLTVARDLTLGFVAASALLLLVAKSSTGPQTVQVAQNLNVHGWLSDSIDVSTKLERTNIPDVPLMRWIRRRKGNKEEPARAPAPEPAAVAGEEEEEEEHETFAEKESGVHHKFEEEVDTLLAADPKEAAAEAEAKKVAKHDEWLSGDIDAHAAPVAVVEPEAEEAEEEDDADEEHKEKLLSDDIDAHEPSAVVVEPEAEAHEEAHDAHDDVHQPFTEHDHSDTDDTHPNVHESFAEEVKEEEDAAKVEHDE